jgi:hypothetical protein
VWIAPPVTLVKHDWLAIGVGCDGTGNFYLDPHFHLHACIYSCISCLSIIISLLSFVDRFIFACAPVIVAGRMNTIIRSIDAGESWSVLAPTLADNTFVASDLYAEIRVLSPFALS